MPLQQVPQNVHAQSKAAPRFRGENYVDRECSCRTNQPTWDCPHSPSQSQHDYCGAKKKAERIIELGLPQLEEVPEGEVVEYDEICVRKSPSLWLWLAISRETRAVLGFVLSDRSDAAFERLRSEEVAPAYWDLPSFSDAWEAYRKMLSAGTHTICDKGSGKTSIVEALNTKWRQRQSGLVRKSCGVSWRIFDDIVERFLILVNQHNRQCLKIWNQNQKTAYPLLEP